MSAGIGCMTPRLGCGGLSAQECTQCPSRSSLFLPTTESHRNLGVRSCVCDMHFYGSVGTACTACPANQLRPNITNVDTTLEDCICEIAYEPDTENVCKQCPTGTFKPAAGDHNCTACPPTLTTEKTGITNASACACAPGHGYTGEICELCTENFFKIGFNLQNCQTCNANTFAAPGSDETLDCACNAGFMLQEPVAEPVASVTPQLFRPSVVVETRDFAPQTYMRTV
jgi:hypothetical protein